MTISNYTELKAAIADYLNRSDLTSQIVDFITLAESDINNVSRLTEQETNATITMVAAQAYNSLPTGFLEVVDSQSFIYDDTFEQISLLPKNRLSRIKSTSQERPRGCYIGARIDYHCPPDSAYTAG